MEGFFQSEPALTATFSSDEPDPATFTTAEQFNNIMKKDPEYAYTVLRVNNNYFREWFNEQMNEK